MGDFLKGNKISSLYQQFICVGDPATRTGVHATTQQLVWTDDGADGKNVFPLTAAQDALQFTTDKRLEFRDDSIYIQSAGDSVLNLVADGEVDISTVLFDLNATGAVTIDTTSGGISLDASGASNFSVDAGHLTFATTTSGEIFLTPMNFVQMPSDKKLQFVDSGEYVSGNGTDLTLGSGGDINLTATGDINIPSGIGMAFGDDGEKIEGDGSDLTIASSGQLFLNSVAGIQIAANQKLYFAPDNHQYIYSDDTNFLIVSVSGDISLAPAIAGDVNIPANIGLTFDGGSDNVKMEYSSATTAFNFDSTSKININSTNNAASAIYLHANGGTSETIKIHSEQGTSVTEGDESISILSDAGGVGIRSTANLANAVNLTADGGASSTILIYNDQGTSVNEGAASIQLLSDAGGINIKSTANLAESILLTTDGGVSETIKIHSDQGTGSGSIEITSDAGGIDINASGAGKAFDLDAAKIQLDSTEASNFTQTVNSSSNKTMTISSLNSGAGVGDLVLNADGQVHIRSDVTTDTYAGAGIQIGTDLSGVDVAIGHTTSDVRIGDNLLVTGGGTVTVSGDMTVTGTLTTATLSYADLTVSDTSPTFTITNTTHENGDLDGTSSPITGREAVSTYRGEKTDGTAHDLAAMVVGHSGTGNDKKGQFQFFVNSGTDTDGALTRKLIIDGDTNISFGNNDAGTGNVLFGQSAGSVIASGGDYNTLIGVEAGEAITTADNNVAIGYQALKVTTTGGTNVAIGKQCLMDNTTGAFNTAIGLRALYNNTTGLNNFAIGNQAMYTNTTGVANLALGGNALFANTTGSYNAGIGLLALEENTTGAYNVAIGVGALNANTTGSQNVAIGHEALQNQTTAIQNVAIGYKSLEANTTGINNTAIGWETLKVNTTGVQNTAVGMKALNANTTGIKNTAVGDLALQVNTTGVGNTAVGSNSALATTEGTYNTAVGYAAGATITTGDKNIFIGNEADGVAATSNQIAIGYSTVTTGQYGIAIGDDVTAATNNCVIGKSGATITVDFSSSGTWTQASDMRKKQDIKEDSLGLDFINDLNTKTYRWKPADQHPEEWKHFRVDENNDKIYPSMDTETVMHGMIAQDVKAALDAAGCSTFGGWSEDENGQQQVSKSMFVIPLIKAVQELTERIKELEK